jgi:polyadenylate-binding protein
MRDENGVSKGYGFVCFSRSEDALSALQTLNSSDGLYVSEAKDKARRMAELERKTYNFKKSIQFLNLYVKGFDPAASEEDLMSYFSEYGKIKSMKVVPGAGQAFVCFVERDAARTAKEQAPNKQFKGRRMYVSYCEPKEQRQANLEESKDKRAYENIKQRQLLSTLASQMGSVSSEQFAGALSIL